MAGDVIDNGQAGRMRLRPLNGSLDDFTVFEARRVVDYQWRGGKLAPPSPDSRALFLRQLSSVRSSQSTLATEAAIWPASVSALDVCVCMRNSTGLFAFTVACAATFIARVAFSAVVNACKNGELK